MDQSTGAGGSPPSRYFWTCLALVAVVALATPFVIGLCLGFYKEGTDVLNHLPRLPVYAMLSGAYAATATALTIVVIGILGTDASGKFSRPRLCPAGRNLLVTLIAIVAVLVIAMVFGKMQMAGALMAQLSSDLARANATGLEYISIAGNCLALVAIAAFAIGCVELMHRSAKAGLETLAGLIRDTNLLLYGASFLLAVGVLTVFTYFSLPVQPGEKSVALQRAQTTAIAASLLFSTILLVFAIPLIALQQNRTNSLVDNEMKKPGTERDKVLKNNGLSESSAYQMLGQGLATLAPILAAFLGIATK